MRPKNNIIILLLLLIDEQGTINKIRISIKLYNSFFIIIIVIINLPG